MEKEQKDNLIQIIITIVLFVAIGFIKDEGIENIAMIVPYIFIGRGVLLEALESIRNKEPFDENFLMSIATIGAFLCGESHEAVMVMLLYRIGEFVEDLAVSKSKLDIEKLMSLKPKLAYIEIEGEGVKEVSPEEVKIGDIIVVKVGDRVPLDGVVASGESLLDTSVLTGETVPRLVKMGDMVSAGMICTTALIKIKVTKLYDESTISKIISLIENADDKKSVSEKFITNFARIYTPAVCLLAILIFAVPSIYGIFVKNYSLIRTWGYRALTSLVISCPCSIIISIPLAFFAIIGKASKKGILIKGSNFVEMLSKVREVMLDKTGTMTKGVFEVVGIHHCRMTEDDILRVAAHAEHFSNHPIAKSIVRKYAKEIDEKIISDVKEMGGHGISAKVNGDLVLLGNEALMKQNSIKIMECSDAGTIVHVAINGSYEGHIHINDIIKTESKEAISRLHAMKINTAMLTGDRKEVAEEVSTSLNIDNIYYELKPDDKFKIVEDKMKEKTDAKLAFVGDGINDAPALRLSDVGIAMGGIGSDEAIEISDVVIMDDNPIKISTSISFAKKCMRVVYENIVFSIIIKASFLLFSSLGLSNMAFATFADVGVMIICVLNSIRLMI